MSDPKLSFLSPQFDPELALTAPNVPIPFKDGDIKPLNIMRDHDGQFILIDLDACVNMNEICGVKLSTSYLPPEMFDFNESKCIIKSPAVEGYTGECVAASHAFDAWAWHSWRPFCAPSSTSSSGFETRS